MSFQIYEDRAGGWRWRLLDDNGLELADSGEGYVSASNARRAARSVRRRMWAARIVTVRT